MLDGAAWFKVEATRNPVLSQELGSLQVERRSARLAAATCVLLSTAALAASCGEGAPTALETRIYESACDSANGTWVIAAPATRLGARVLVLAVRASHSAEVTEVPSFSASGALGTGFLPASVIGAAACSTIRVSGTLASSGMMLSVDAQLRGDTLHGYAIERLADGLDVATKAFGLRVDPALLTTADSAPPVQVLSDSIPTLLIRLDDARAADRAFLPRLAARHLIGGLAVPTRLVGGADFLTWTEISAWSAAGFGVDSHSRYHSGTTDPDLGFMTELVGSLADLRSHGFRTRVFVQPGTWQDALNFDSPAKLASWRGAFIRDFYEVLEGYVGSDHAPMGVVGQVPFGVTHSTLSDGVSNSFILWQWHRMFTPRTFTVLSIHSYNLQSIDQLDWLLDSVQAAVASGRLRLARTSADLITSAVSFSR